MVGLRENERRMELLGYDSRRYKLMAFVIAGGLALRRPVLWEASSAEMFSLNQAAMVVIWVIVGGRSLLLGAIIGTLLIQYLTTAGHGGRGAGHAEPGFHIDSLRAAVSAGAGAGMQEPAGPAAAAAARRERLMTQPDIILEARGVGKRFGGVRALGNIDFTLRRGELRCLIGPNGAGKKHLLQAAQRSDGAVGG